MPHAKKREKVTEAFLRLALPPLKVDAADDDDDDDADDARVFILLIDTATQEVPMKNIWKKSSVQFLRYAIELLHVKVAHVTNDVKWRPIVTTFGTLIENISRTGLYDCHIFLTILWAILTAV